MVVSAVATVVVNAVLLLTVDAVMLLLGGVGERSRFRAESSTLVEAEVCDGGLGDSISEDIVGADETW